MDDLSNLSREELHQEFLQANHEYERALYQYSADSRQQESFIKIRIRLNDAIDELERRRNTR